MTTVHCGQVNSPDNLLQCYMSRECLVFITYFCTSVSDIKDQKSKIPIKLPLK